MARETLADLREQRDNAIDRAIRAEREVILLRSLIGVLRSIVAEAERIEGGRA